MKRWLQTQSCLAFDLENPEVDMVRIGDIATSLAYTPRYNGHTGTTYSVAEHSVFVSRYCSAENKLWGLLHDAAEAYTGDIISPMKRLLPSFPSIERNIQDVICDAFQLCRKEPAEVKEVDARLLATEKAHFFKQTPRDWSVKLLPYDDLQILALKPEEAKSLFLREFFILRGRSI